MTNDSYDATEQDRTKADEASAAGEQASNQAGPFIDLPSRWDRWEPLAEVIATVVLALATLATAWEDAGRPAGSAMFYNAITAYQAVQTAPGPIAEKAQQRIRQMGEMTNHH